MEGVAFIYGSLGEIEALVKRKIDELGSQGFHIVDIKFFPVNTLIIVMIWYRRG